MTYRGDLIAAQRRLDSWPREQLQDSRFGTVEYVMRGEGPTVLVSHPLLGGFDVGLRIAQLYLGEGCRLIVPSRFGYLGSTLQRNATAADQADAYKSLLDTLEVNRVAVFGYSAGGPSALHFALRHPDRLTVLMLLAPPLPGKTGRPPRPIGNYIFGSDLFFWTVKKYLPRVFARILGMPKPFPATTDERALLDERGADLFPIAPRQEGALFDVYVSTPSVQNLRLEDLDVPTLLMNARDDGLSAFTNASSAAALIPNVTFIPFDQGGHLLVGHESSVRDETRRFLGATA